MDSPPEETQTQSQLKNNNNNKTNPSLLRLTLTRCTLFSAFLLLTVVSLSYAVGLLAFILHTLDLPPLSVPVSSQCKVISSSVDLRASKICELGLLNYKAKRVFYPSSKTRKFRCRYDYYWASVFQVEYMDHFSGQTLVGLAEAPKEALPNDCRPNFATAWLTKHSLKVNETYDCWYTSGLSKVEIFQDSFFGCQEKDPSAFEMMRRYFILSTRMLQSGLSGQLQTKFIGWEMLAGAVGGFFTAIMSFSLFAICRKLFLAAGSASIAALIRRVFLSRIFFLLAYFSIVGWLTIQYGKRIGLGDLLGEY